MWRGAKLILFFFGRVSYIFLEVLYSYIILDTISSLLFIFVCPLVFGTMINILTKSNLVYLRLILDFKVHH